MPSCSFSEIFKNTAKDLEKPSSSSANETVYSRSDYDGYKWWTTWNKCNKEKPTPALIQEINQFHNALFSMKEFQSLDTMRRICRFAECTNDSTEYNLYSETEHFYIWIRMITRFRDYNLYVHYHPFVNSHIMLLPFLLHLLGFLYILVSMDLFFYYIQYQKN